MYKRHKSNWKVNFAWLKMVIKQIIYISHYIYIYIHTYIHTHTHTHTRKDILIQLYKNAKSKVGDLGRK